MREKITPSVTTVSSWRGFLGWVHDLPRPDKRDRPKWIYRGHDQSHYRLATSLEREARDLRISVRSLGKLEGRVSREFRRHLHHYTEHVPHALDIVELFAIMQHFGAPTRLQDWTYSPFVASYFAIEEAHAKSCSVWAIDAAPLMADDLAGLLGHEQIESDFAAAHAEHMVPLDIDPSKALQSKVASFLFRHPRRCVSCVNPYRLNERLTVQQGVFLMPGDLTLTLESNLASMSLPHGSIRRVDVELGRDTRKEFLLNLYRMNISRATLFPGLEGYAESLRTRLAIPETLSR
jgi:hypothetical protein